MIIASLTHARVYSRQDPYLGSQMVPPIISGIQGQGVIANAKHFFLNNQETDRYGVNAVVDERTMMEIYAPPFEAAVADANVGSFMCSYNRITASTYTDEASWACEDKDTLVTLLKERLGFEGWVMSDWTATHSTEKAALSGLDMEMPEMVYFGPLLADAVARGEVNESAIDDKVRCWCSLPAYSLPKHAPSFSSSKRVPLYATERSISFAVVVPPLLQLCRCYCSGGGGGGGGAAAAAIGFPAVVPLNTGGADLDAHVCRGDHGRAPALWGSQRKRELPRARRPQPANRGSCHRAPQERCPRRKRRCVLP